MHVKKIRKFGNSAVIVIPKQIFETLGWQFGDSMEVKLVDGGLLFTRIEKKSD